MAQRRLLLAASLSATLTCGAIVAHPLSAQTADFYKKTPIKMIVGYAPGGGVDLYSRMLARYMGEHIPGTPSFVVQNMPGAGSMRAVQSIQTAPSDGSYIVGFNPGTITLSLLEPDQVKFRFTDVAYLGSIGAETQLCMMWHTTGVKTLEEFLKRPKVHLAASAPGTSGYIMGSLLRNMFDANVDQVTGYTGRSEQHLAIERGEADGKCGSWDSTPQSWKGNGKINVVVRFTKGLPPDMPDSPYIMDLANAEQRQIITLLLAINDMFRPYIVSKNIPPERLQVLQDAFMKTVNSEAFLAQSKKEGRIVDNPMPGPEVTKLVSEMYSTPPDVVSKAMNAIK